MQTTLLGFAIALILALAAALVGPHFVDWNRYRAEFETQASRLTSRPVRIEGAIEARLLPTPTLTLGRIEIARPGGAGAIRARRLGIEFSLSALMSGHWRASELRIEGAEFTAQLDDNGRLDWLAPTIALDPDSVSIERLHIVDGRATLADAASGSQLVLENVEFHGELRSLLGPAKGEGSFVHAGHHYPYRIAASRAGETGVRVRLNVEPIDRPLIADVDTLVVIEDGVPRFEGGFTLVRPIGRADDGIVQSWRLTSRIRGTNASAVLEQIEFQYGPDERAIRLRGDANLTFGPNPQLVVGLASTQIDLDRVLGLPEPSRRRPLVAVKSFADFFGGAQRPPIPVRLGISVENVTLAGAMLQRVSGEVVGDVDSWNLDVLEFRAPGATQVGLSGRLNFAAGGIAFDGRAKIDARDPRALAAWLTDRVDAQAITATTLRAEGDVKLGSDRIAVDDLTAEVDRMKMEGSLAYSWASGDRPPRIELALSAPDIDLDRAYALAQGALADTVFEWPREGTLSLKVGRTMVAGVEARQADIDLKFDRRRLEIARLSIGDFGGAAIAVTGSVDTQASRGTLAFGLDGRSFDGIAKLIEKFAPQSVAEFRRWTVGLVPAKLQASLIVGAESSQAAGSPNVALRIAGSAGGFKLDLQAQTHAAVATFTAETLSRLAATKLDFTGRIDASEGGALVELLGLAPLVAVGTPPGRLTFAANGPLDGDMVITGELVAGGLDASAEGSLRLAGTNGATARTAVRIAQATLRNPRPHAAGRPTETLPIALTAKLALADGVVDLTDIAGKAAGTDVGGRLKIGLAQPVTVDGDIDIVEIDLLAVIGAATGTSLQKGTAAVWPAEPFEQGLLGGVSGQLRIKSAHVALTPRQAVRNVRSIVHFDQSKLAFEQIDGAYAGGRVAGEIVFQRSTDSIAAHSRLRITDADLAELVRGGPPPLSGRLTTDIEVEGSGRSPIALVGALKGSGTFTLRDGGIARLDPGAFGAAIRSVDQGSSIDPERVRESMEHALAAGALTIALAEGEISIADGQAHLANTVVHTQGADLAVNGRAGLTEDSIDAKLVLSGTARPDSPGGARPAIAITLKGPAEAPRRALDVAGFSNWLALRVVEQQSKRIDALESRSVDPSGAQDPASAAQPSATAPTGTIRPAPQPRPRSTTQPAVPSVSPARPPLDLRPPPPPRRSSVL